MGSVLVEAIFTLCAILSVACVTTLLCTFSLAASFMLVAMVIDGVIEEFSDPDL
jgi:hypothetical protein